VQVTFFVSKLPLCMWWSGPSSNTWFLEPTWVHISNDISISSAVFVGLTVVTDQPTYWQTPRYWVCSNWPHLHSSEMHPNNKLCNIVVKDGTNQSHNISEIYSVCLYQATNFLNTPRMIGSVWYLAPRMLTLCICIYKCVYIIRKVCGLSCERRSLFGHCSSLWAPVSH